MIKDKDNLPDFLILGAPKAGTTAIYHALRNHPSVFMPNQKELRFFAFDGKHVSKADPVNRKVVTEIGAYRFHFSNSREGQLKGEASPVYLSSEQAPSCIKRYVPEVRMIAIVRNPVERAFSHYLYSIQQGYEPKDVGFIEALSEPYVHHRGFRRVRPYVEDSLYGKSLNRYFHEFGREQIYVIKYEDFRENTDKVFDDICDFLELDSSLLSSSGGDYAASGLPKSMYWHTILKSRFSSWPLKALLGIRNGEALRARLIKSNLYKPKLSHSEWAKAYQLFEQDITLCEKLTGLNCNDWKEFSYNS